MRRFREFWEEHRTMTPSHVVSRRAALALGAAAALPRLALAQRPTVRIGVLNDQTGPYRDWGGQGSVAAVRQAVRDFGDQGFSVDVVVADHQNKPDVGAGIARQWCDTGVDMV